MTSFGSAGEPNKAFRQFDHQFRGMVETASLCLHTLHRFMHARIPIYGYVYDVKTGRLIEVPAAKAAGKSTTAQTEKAR